MAKKKSTDSSKSEFQTKSKSKSKSKSTSDPETYTDPDLRDRLKDEITAGDKGGKPGQWSARKAQLLAHEYEKAGGDYKNGEKQKTEAQEHLDSWTDEDWRTADGKDADREGGMTRYLPAEAWDKLTPAQQKATNAKKREGSKQGEQFVANTAAAKRARKSVTKTKGDTKADDQSKPAKGKKKKPAQ